jgi:FtsH-binding integral membrane protein
VSRVDAGRAPDVTRAASWADLGVAGVVFAWITVVLLIDRDAGIWLQRLLGLATWALLVGLLRRETPLVRAQVAVVVVFATAVEYTFSPLLEVYVYRLENVPSYVPPGHGLVYLCALALGRTCWFHRWKAQLTVATVLVGGAYAGWGLFVADRQDALGAFWFACLVGFLCLGRSRTLYIGAFLIVTYLELVGTAAATWTWQERDPTGLVTIGNPPSGAAGGYGWFDLAALYLAPVLLRAVTRARGAGDAAPRGAGGRWTPARSPRPDPDVP